MFHLLMKTASNIISRLFSILLQRNYISLITVTDGAAIVVAVAKAFLRVKIFAPAPVLNTVLPPTAGWIGVLVPVFATDCRDAVNCVPFRYKAKLGAHQPLVNSHLNSKSHNTFGSEQVLYPWIPQHVLLPFR